VEWKVSKMKETELVDLLSAHAEGLKQGVDLTDELIAKKPAEDQRALKALLALARRVQSALTPVEPHPAFLTDLKARLRTDARQARLALERDAEMRRKWIGLAAGLGGIFYMAGLMMVSWRLSLALLGLIAGFLGGRVARSALPKTRLSR
jgi:hypothetical protein